MGVWFFFLVAIIWCSSRRILIFFSTAASKIHPAHVVSVIYPVSRINALYPVSHNWESSSGTFSGLLQILGQQSADVGSLVTAAIQPWQGFQGPSGRRGADVPVRFCQALLQLSRQRIPIVWAQSLLSEGAHREHSKEHADAYPAVHCFPLRFSKVPLELGAVSPVCAQAGKSGETQPGPLK